LAVGTRADLPNVLDFSVSQHELIHEVHVIRQSGFADSPTLATDQDDAMALCDEAEHFGLLLCERPEVVLDSGAKFLSALGTPNPGERGRCVNLELDVVGDAADKRVEVAASEVLEQTPDDEHVRVFQRFARHARIIGI
jgi:hypothetical protein